MSGFLSGPLAQWLAGLAGQQQQPAPPSQSQAPAATPAASPSLAGPLAQGALGALFGYMSQPRDIHIGAMQRLGAAGLGGLQGYESAREQQLKYPLQQAELQTKQAELGLEQGKAKQQAELFQQRKQMLEQFDQDPQMQKLDPLQKMVLRNGLLEGRLSLKDLGIEPITPFQKAELDIRRQGEQSLESQRQFEQQARERQLGMEAQGLGLRGQELGLRNQELGLQIQRQRQEAGLMPLKEQELKARIAALQAGKPLTDAEIEREAQAAAKASTVGWKAGMLEREPTFEQRKAQREAQVYQEKLTALKQQQSANRAGAAMSGEGGAAGGIDPGYTAIGPDGKTHRFKGGDSTDPANWEPID